jgi:murein DD-endopeptidase MepM/ murein hydrolase activator NlpD
MKLPHRLPAVPLTALSLPALPLPALSLAVLFLALSPITADAAAHSDPTDAGYPTGAAYSTVAARAAMSPGRVSPRAGPVLAPAWSWPLSPRPAVLRAFNPPARPWLSGHRGVDLGTAFDGAPLVSPAAGTVSFVGTVVDRPVITIDHGNGLRSSFEPVASSLRAGSAVAEGDVLGKVQTGHCGPAPPPCLHWGVRRGEDYVNPLAFVMDLRPSVLLPPLKSDP